MQDHEYSIDLRDLFLRLAMRPWWLIGCIIVFTGAAVAAALLVKPIYRASTLLTPANVGRGQGGSESVLGQFGGLAALAGVHLQDGDRETQEALAVLQSRQFTERFFHDANALPVFFPHEWNREQRRWRDPAHVPGMGRAFRKFDRDVRRVIESKKTGLITLQIDWTDPVTAASWANLLVTQLNAEMRARAIANSDKSVAFLERELASTTVVEVRGAVNHLIEAQIKQRMLASVNEDYAFQVVDRAIAPDRDEPVSPNKLVYAIGGAFAGALVGALLVLSMGRGRNLRQDSTPASMSGVS